MPTRHLAPLTYIEEVARAGSIRKAAETLAITSTALNRRVLALEEETGRAALRTAARGGVRLSTAGELLISHIRRQASEYEKLKSQIADLSGERRGNVAMPAARLCCPISCPNRSRATGRNIRR